MLDKIVLQKTTSAIFLAIVLGTITLMHPSFIVGVQAESDDDNESDNNENNLIRMEDNDESSEDEAKDDDESDNDELKDNDNNSNQNNNDEIKEVSYGQNSNSYYKSKDSSSSSVSIKKIKCNNINVNLNGVDVDIGLPNGNDPIAEVQALESNSFESDSESNGQDGQLDLGTDSRIVCINNNNNAGQQETPTEPPVEELATLQITKAIPCFTTGTGQESVCSAIFAAITPDLFDITVSGNNPNPSNFEGSGTQTIVTLGPGNYQISETPDSSLSTIISNLETTQNTEISGPQSIFNGDCTKQGDHFATGTITEGETQDCVINNAFTVESVTIPE